MNINYIQILDQRKMFWSPMKFQARASVFYSDAGSSGSSDKGIAYYAKQAF